jgi:tetratricopeptide (TPR) repeat protein
MRLHQRRFDEAFTEIFRTLAIDPLLAEANMTLGRIHVATGQLDDGVMHLLTALELSPQFSYAREQLVHAYVAQGKLVEALAECRRAAAHDGPRERALLAYASARAGHHDEATAILDELLVRAENDYVPPYQVAMAYAALGNDDAAFDWLRRACSERDPQVTSLAVTAAFEPLRADPRYREISALLALPVRDDKDSS